VYNVGVISHSPYCELDTGSWLKLICGASFHHLPSIRNLALVYSLAGVDCIDFAAEPAVLHTVQAGVDQAQILAQRWSMSFRRPWLMASLNAGEDPHFRKAYFDPTQCPSDCPRPCERVCPALAIDHTGVLQDRCYGCGRCEPVCPLGLVEFVSKIYAIPELVQFLLGADIDAIEVHTQPTSIEPFYTLFEDLRPLLPRLKLFSVSVPDGEGLENFVQQVSQVIQNSSLSEQAKQHLVWQTDGRPMSGDLGATSTSRQSVALASKFYALQPKGHLQLAGGTNHKTAALMDTAAFPIAGVAFGSYARKLVQEEVDGALIEDNMQCLSLALNKAQALVAPYKPHLEIRCHG
jgi:Fe-S-cluster-containing hydrogenase component 2